MQQAGRTLIVEETSLTEDLRRQVEANCAVASDAPQRGSLGLRVMSGKI